MCCTCKQLRCCCKRFSTKAVIVLSEFIHQELGQKIIIAHPESQEELNQYYQLRHEILRAPWNQPPGSEKVNDDNSCHSSLPDD